MNKKIVIILLVIGVHFLSYAQLSTIYHFVGTNTGSNPYGTPISDGVYLYGLTQSGGVNAKGNVFKIKLDGTGYVNLYDFDGNTGAYPYGSLVSDGTYLYGMTRNGGVAFVHPSIPDNGVIFRIKPDGTGFSVLYEFDGTNSGDNINGAMPNGGDLILIGQTLYGMTGSKDVVFKIDTDGNNYTNLFDFSFPNGQYPLGTLITDSTYLYGVTEGGGSNNWGTIFKIKTDGTDYNNVFEFYNTLSYSNPHGSLLSDGTNFYGMAVNCVYKIKHDGTGFDTIVKFKGVNGSLNNYNTFAQNSLITDGTYLYGVTNEGGANSKGCVFKVKNDGTSFSKLADFNGTNGQNPNGSLILVGGDLYGMTTLGGTFGKGTIYKIANQVTSIHENKTTRTVKVFPNPTNDILNVKIFSNLLNIKENSKVTITNVLGKVIYSAKSDTDSFKLDISNYESGLYFISIEDPENTISTKFIKH